MRGYFRGLTNAIGRGWNDFWFPPTDPASLGLLRVLVGLLALYYVAAFSPDLIRLFGADGLLPSESVRTFLSSQSSGGPQPEARVSYFHWFASAGELWVMHAVGLVVLSLFTAGVFSRVTSVLALCVVLSYIHRAPMLTGPLEPVLAFALFYLCLAPCGAWLSVDALRVARRPRPEGWDPLRTDATVATRLLQIHACLVYAMMGITMLAAPSLSWWDGEAMWFLIARPESRLADLTWLHAHTYFINAWTHWVVLYELAFVIFVWNRWARPLLLLLGVPHWIALAVVTGLAPFCALMLVLNLAFVPGQTVRAYFARARAQPRTSEESATTQASEGPGHDA